MKWNPKRGIAITLVAAMIALSTGRVQASLAPASNATRTQDMQTVQSFLEQQEVVQHLSEMQLTPSEIQSRLGNLSDQELHEVATRVHQQQPGRDGGGVVVTILVIGILVLLFVYLLKRV